MSSWHRKVVFVNALHPLGELIDSVLTRNGWSTRDLANRSRTAGEYMSHTNFGRLKNEPLVSIKGATVKLLARVLQVPESVVAAAALDSMGVERGFDAKPDIATAVHNSIDLSARDRKIILTVIDAMRDETDGQHHGKQDGDPETNNVHQLRPSSQGVVSSEKSTEGWAAYKPGGKSMKRHQVEKQDTDAEGSQDPDDHKGK